MSVAVKISVTGRNFNGSKYDSKKDYNGKKTVEDVLQQVKFTLITVAKDVLQEELQKGFDKNYKTVTDNKVGKPIEEVKPLGKIEFFSQVNYAQMLLTIYDRILEKSPKRSGAFRGANIVLCNGKVIARTRASLKIWAEKKLPLEDFSRPVIVRFVNIAAYARFLETYGVTISGSSVRRREQRYKNKKRGGGTNRILKLPNGTYYLTYRVIKYLFKSMKSVGEGIKFEYLTGDMFGIRGMSAASGFKRTTFKKDGRNYLYPSIVLELDKFSGTVG